MSVTEPDENELGDGLADLERRRRAERVRSGLRVAAQSGFYTAAKAPYGYQKVAVNDRGSRRYKLEPDPQDVGTVRRIFEARRQGAKVRNIMEQLNEEGIPSPTGQGHQWTVGQVRRIPEQRGLLRNHLGQGTSHGERRLPGQGTSHGERRLPGQGTSHGERRLPGQGAQRFPCDHLPGRV